MKNRSEKGTRKLELLSNPHSKGEPFSRLNIPFLASTIAKTITNLVINIVILEKTNRWKITSPTCGSSDWKSDILIVLEKLISSSIDGNK